MTSSGVGFWRHRALVPALIAVVVALVARWLSWPGMATHDTLFVTAEAVHGQYTTYHPILNALLIRILAVPFQSYWFYTTVQISLCTLLMIRSVTLANLHHNRRWPAFATLLVWVLAAPTILFLGMIWKDVPTAYCLGFVASLAYHLRTAPDARITKLDSILLGLSIFLSVALRHGMVFNLILIPVIIGLSRFKGDRRLWVPYAIAVAGILALAGISRSPIVLNNEAHLLKLKISAISQPFLGIVSNRNGYSSDDLGYDNALAKRVFGATYAREYAPDYFRNNVVLHDLRGLRSAYRAILKRTPRLCILNISQCVSGRVQMMLGTLQPSTRFGGMKFYDLGVIPDCQRVNDMDAQRCAILYEFETSEKPASSQRVLRWSHSELVEGRGLRNNLLVWNLLPALGLVLAILVVFTPRSPLWVVAAFILAQCVLPFATAMANDFRYYYFLAPFFALFLPHFLVELRLFAAEAVNRGQ